MDRVRDWGIDQYRRFNQRRADADAFFARSREEVMRDLAINLAPKTKVEGPIVSNVVSLDAYRAARGRRP